MRVRVKADWYNAQAVVAENLLVVAAEAVQAPDDPQPLAPMLDKIATLPAYLGNVDELLADTAGLPRARILFVEPPRPEP